jgi:aspartate racemase
MAIVGIVGGLGPESTIDYYRRLIARWQVDQPESSPSIVIDSLDVQTGLRLVANDRPGLIDYLSGSIDRLASARCDFVAMSANTAHVVFEEVAARSRVPLLSIVETCADEASRLGLRRLGLIGTRFTMEAGFYPSVFARRNIEVVAPSPDERVWIHERYVGELLKGDFRDATRDGIIRIVERLKNQNDLDGLILGGTELPLLLKSPTIVGLPSLDTTAVHVDAIVARLRQIA